MPTGQKENTMSDLTPKDIVEIEKFTTTAHEKYTGLIMDSTIQGRANSNSVAAYVLGRGLPLTMENLDAAVVALQFVLFWTVGNAPVVAPSRDSKILDSLKYTPSIHSDRANGVESSWTKDIREGKEKNAARLAAKAKADLRFRETNQVVQGINGRQDYAASNALNEEARRRHAAEDAAQSGKPAPVATGFRIIPDGETNFKGPAEAPYTSAELSAYLARRKGGHLLR
jgi:hypothetical protein